MSRANKGQPMELARKNHSALLADILNDAENDPAVMAALRPELLRLSRALNQSSAAVINRVIIEPGETILFDVNTLSGDALNWAAFVSLFGPMLPDIVSVPAVTIGSVTLPAGQYLSFSNGYENLIWQPEQNAEQASKLIDGFSIASRRVNAKWFAIASADLGSAERPQWCQYTYKDGERYGPASYMVASRRQRFEDCSRLVACLRAAIASSQGTKVAIPAILVR